jgi:hypothetical protein
MESIQKLGISSVKQGISIDRRLSVAPMMDWTDHVEFASWFSHLAIVKKGLSPLCLLQSMIFSVG